MEGKGRYGLSYTYITHTAQQSHALGERLARVLRPGDFVALWGDIGAGKTTLVKGVGHALGYKDITSPTFSIVQSHEGQAVCLHHFDAYRLQDAQELFDMGFEEYVQNGILLMEWPEHVQAALPGCRLDIHITGAGEGPRTVTFMPQGGFVFDASFLTRGDE